MHPRLLLFSLLSLFLASCASRTPVMQPELSGMEPPGNAAERAHGSKPRQTSRPAEPERIGLATSWGRTEKDTARPTRFERDAPVSPLGVVKLFYNDAAGAAAMTGGQGRATKATVLGANGLVRMSLADDDGEVLPALQAGSIITAVGEPGKRWILLLENLTSYRLELVSSVDGLDVIDGKPGAVTRRGYVTGPGERIQVRGWRTGLGEVAAFSFSKAGESYARIRHGDTRHIGVVGCAVFNEKGTQPSVAGEAAGQQSEPGIIDPGESGFATPPADSES